MKKIFCSVLLTNSLVVSSMFGNEHLKDIDYETVYPKKVYEKSYFGVAITGAVIVGAGAFTYFTAGAGAPAAATGVSTIASWTAGGGAGSYMSGLSTIGGWFGGNAILGASILNGISIGTIGGGSSFATLSLLGKIGLMASISASALDGVFYFKNPETQQLEYKIKVAIPKELGSGNIRELVDEIYKVNANILEAIENKKTIQQKHLTMIKEENNRYSLDLLEYYLNNNENSQENLLVLGIIAWNNGKYEIFEKAISKIDKNKLENTSFYNYLFALSDLYNGKIDDAKLKLENSMDENKYALEPVILYINILANEDFKKNENKIIECVQRIEKDFDSDDYATEYSLVSIYYRVATIYFNAKRYPKAKEFYEKAEKELSLYETYFSKSLKYTIQLGVANSSYQDGKIDEANKLYNDIIKEIEDKEEKNMIQAQYLGVNHE